MFEAISDHALVEAMSGFSEVKASARFLVEKTGCPLMIANRSVNLLCSLGILEKVPGSGLRGDRLLLGQTSPHEVLGRWEQMGNPDLHSLKRELVERTLGENIADSVFRRAPEH